MVRVFEVRGFEVWVSGMWFRSSRFSRFVDSRTGFREWDFAYGVFVVRGFEVGGFTVGGFEVRGFG